MPPFHRLPALALVLTLLAIARACQRRPSETPLGAGPLARAEAAARERLAERRLEAERAEEQRDRQQTAARAQSDDTDEDEEEEPGSTADDEDDSEQASEDSEDAADDGEGQDEDDEDDDGEALVLADLEGEYRGEDSSVYELEGLPERREEDDSAVTRVEARDEPRLALIIVDSSNGKDLCTVEATLEGKVARVEPGQTCFEAERGPVSTVGRVASGRARFSASGRLVFDMTLDFELQAGERTFTGTVKYHFEGTRDD